MTTLKGITVDPLVWQMINHNVRNDLDGVTLQMEELRLAVKDLSLARQRTALDFYRAISLLVSRLLNAYQNVLERAAHIDKFLTQLELDTLEHNETKG